MPRTRKTSRRRDVPPPVEVQLHYFRDSDGTVVNYAEITNWTSCTYPPHEPNSFIMRLPGGRPRGTRCPGLEYPAYNTAVRKLDLGVIVQFEISRPGMRPADTDPLELMRDLRADGWCVELKCLPAELGYIIEGARSEYDAPCEDRTIGKGKWLCECQDMAHAVVASRPWRRNQWAMAHTPDEAVLKVWQQVQAAKTKDPARQLPAAAQPPNSDGDLATAHIAFQERQPKT